MNVLTPSSLKGDEAAAAFRAHNADAAVVVAYGLLLPKPILDAPQLGCFNIHASLLPRWRGAAPIHRAIMAGDDATGVTIMKMDEGLDTGDMAMVDRVAIGPDVTTGDMHDVLARTGAEAMARALDALEPRHAQADASSRLTALLTRRKSPRTKPASTGRSRRARCTTTSAACRRFPARGSRLDGVRVKVLRSTMGEGKGQPGAVLDGNLTIACGDGAVRLVQVQRAGAKAMTADEFLRGTPLKAGIKVA